VWHVDKYKITCNPLNAELNPICHWLALIGAHHILHISRIRVKLVINHWTHELLQHIVVSSGQHLGRSFPTHSRILFSSEYFHYKIFIHENYLEN